MKSLSLTQVQIWYDISRKSLVLFSLLAGPASLFINAPFGRFSPAADSIFLLDGIVAWISMELVSPLVFTYTFLSFPLSVSPLPFSLKHPSTLLSVLFLTHYINRSLVSPLRTPSRSKSHIIVPLSAVLFNCLNGFSMGAYLSSPSAHSFLTNAYREPIFYVGIGMWAIGFAGNIIHDEILLNIRRKARSKEKSQEIQAKERDQSRATEQYYAIPRGWLYEYISYPNYFCEWVEWAGFALAAAPLPALSPVIQSMSSLSFRSPFTSAFTPTLTPPFIFFMSQIILMLPRAYRGHEWYLQKFPDYPKDRRVVLPFVL